MNAQDLYTLVDGAPKPAGVWYCSTCRVVHREKNGAERCCAPKLCEECGAECEQYYTVCRACRDKASLAEEAARFEKAIKTTDADGPFYCDGLGQEFFQDIEALEEHLEFEDERPLYVWCCSTHRVVNVDVDSILNGLCDDAYEGFDPDELDGIEDLRAAVARFNAANQDVVRWEPDFTTARLIPAAALGHRR